MDAKSTARAVVGRVRGDAASRHEELAEYDARIRRLRRDLSGLQQRVAGLEQQLERTARSGTLDLPLEIPAVRIAPTPRVDAAITAVVAEHLSYLGAANLRTLGTVVSELEATETPGVIIEAGTALGGSAIVMAAAKAADRPLRVYDVFGMIPPPGERDGKDVHARYETIASGASTGLHGEVYYGYRDDLLGEVTAAFARHGVAVEQNAVELIQGLFEDTLVVEEPVALAHLDGDWYESTMTCLLRIVPRLVVGGRLVIDDYGAWSGCRTAIDEYFTGRTGFRFEQRGRLHIVRV